MIIPVRCFTCGSVIAGKWRAYERECAAFPETEARGARHEAEKVGWDAGAQNAPGGAGAGTGRGRGVVMDKLGIKRLCCRRHFLGNVDLMDEM